MYDETMAMHYLKSQLAILRNQFHYVFIENFSFFLCKHLLYPLGDSHSLKEISLVLAYKSFHSFNLAS